MYIICFINTSSNFSNKVKINTRGEHNPSVCAQCTTSILYAMITINLYD